MSFTEQIIDNVFAKCMGKVVGCIKRSEAEPRMIEIRFTDGTGFVVEAALSPFLALRIGDLPD